ARRIWTTHVFAGNSKRGKPATRSRGSDKNACRKLAMSFGFFIKEDKKAIRRKRIFLEDQSRSQHASRRDAVPTDSKENPRG
ncbi:MAG TPA: hypothetical protein VFE89_08090, partial [Beijerinckiaceae bacterium]|nr:hypothetical protein [Beijerinckiaceae bacterium]